jgi:hypothetical protein
MPPRSNDFQKLILALTQLLGGNAVVEESKMLADLVSVELTEVDVYAEGALAGHAVRIGIECRDHKRKQGPGWVNEMRSKHERLPTNLLILVSSSGFSGPAIAKADSFGIKTITPTQADSDLANEVLASLGVTATVWVISDVRSSVAGTVPTERLERNARAVLDANGQIPLYGSDGSLLIMADGNPLADNPGTFNMTALSQLIATDQRWLNGQSGSEFDVETPTMHNPRYFDQHLHAYWTADGEQPTLVPVAAVEIRGRVRIVTEPVHVSPSGQIVYDGNSYLTGTTPMADGQQARIVVADPEGERLTRADFPVYIPPPQQANRRQRRARPKS